MFIDFAEVYFIQIIATVLGVALSISETITVGIAVNAFIKIKKEEDKLNVKVKTLKIGHHHFIVIAKSLE